MKPANRLQDYAAKHALGLTLRDGTGKTVRFSKSSIKRALLGDTNYVGTYDNYQACIVANEDSDDVSLSRHDDHYQSYSLNDIDTAIADFMRIVEEVL